MSSSADDFNDTRDSVYRHRDGAAAGGSVARLAVIIITARVQSAVISAGQQLPVAAAISVILSRISIFTGAGLLMLVPSPSSPYRL